VIVYKLTDNNGMTGTAYRTPLQWGNSDEGNGYDVENG